MRLIGVIMGAKTSESRNEEMVKLLEYGFTNYELKSLYEKDAIYKKIDSIFYKNPINVKFSSDIGILKKKTDELKDIQLIEYIDYEKINQGEIENIGKITINYDNKTYDEISLCLESKAKKNNFFNIILKLIVEIF